MHQPPGLQLAVGLNAPQRAHPHQFFACDVEYAVLHNLCPTQYMPVLQVINNVPAGCTAHGLRLLQAHPAWFIELTGQ